MRSLVLTLRSPAAVVALLGHALTQVAESLESGYMKKALDHRVSAKARKDPQADLW